MRSIRQRRFFIIAGCPRWTDRLLALVADDRRRATPRSRTLFGDLELHRLVAEPRDRPVDAAGRDHPVAHLQRGEERLHLLLPLLHRQQDDEVEDRRGRATNGMNCSQGLGAPWAARPWPSGRECPNPASQVQIERGHESRGRREADRRNPCLNVSKVRNAIASLILRMVSR